MEKRRNTLDRFQRLGFGRKSSPSTSNQSAGNDNAATSKGRKSSEKTEKLKELTELLRLGGAAAAAAHSSSPPPPIPPPRKPRMTGFLSQQHSLDKPDVPSTPKTQSLTETTSNTISIGGNITTTEPYQSHTINHQMNDKLLMDQVDNQATNNLQPSGNISLSSVQERDAEAERDEEAEQKAEQENKQKHCHVQNINNDVTYSSNSSNTKSNTLNSPQTSCFSTSQTASNLDMLLTTATTTAAAAESTAPLTKREQSKSPPPPPTSLSPSSPSPLASSQQQQQQLQQPQHPTTIKELLEEESEHESAADGSNSSFIATKLDKPESRTVIGSYCQKSIPYRSASFSQVDYTSGKYKKSALSALRDRFKREKSVDSTSPTNSLFNSVVENFSWPRKKIEEEEDQTSPPASPQPESPQNPIGIYIPLKSELSINLCYGHDKSLEDVMESPELMPDEEVFMADAITEVPDEKLEACMITMQAAHAKMESLTDTIQSENDYAIEDNQVPVTVEEAKDLQEARSDSVDIPQATQGDSQTRNANTIAGNLTENFEPNLATLMEEQMPLESPPDNILQTATTCLIPLSVYECAAQEWGMENPPREWEVVAPEEFAIIPETIEPMKVLIESELESSEAPPKETALTIEVVPRISVSRSSEDMDDQALLRKEQERTTQVNSQKSDEPCSPTEEIKVERRQPSLDIKKRYSRDDMDLDMEKRSSLENIATRNSADERRKADILKRRKGIYFENWHEPAADETDNSQAGKSLALDITIANLNAIKPDTPELDNIMYINSPITDDTRTPGSLYSFDLNTPDSECRQPPVWCKHPIMSSFSCQSSEEKDDVPLASPPASHMSTGHPNKSFSFLRTDSVSDNESDRTPPPSRDRTSPSPAPSENDFKRFSKRPLRGPYAQMLENEMKKPNNMHFEEILEELRDGTDGGIQTRRQRSSNDDAGGRVNIPQHSNSMRVRKTTNNTYLPVPQHTRAASTPSQIENVTKKGSGGGGGGKGTKDSNELKPLEKKSQSTLDTSKIGRDDIPTSPVAQVKPLNQKISLLREMKRASSEVPAGKATHSKRSQSMSAGDKSKNAHLQHIHQQKRSLDVTSSHKQKAAKSHEAAASASASPSPSATTPNILPTPELLAQLLKGSSEKLISEQRQQMYALTEVGKDTTNI